MNPRNLSLVYFDFESIPKTYKNEYPFIKDHPYIFLGEIPNMPGHCVVLDYTNNEIYSGYHTDNFVEYNENEV